VKVNKKGAVFVERNGRLVEKIWLLPYFIIPLPTDLRNELQF
jgi:hypothetical protein